MQTIIDAAAQIASEIERTRAHLEKLEQALNGLRPLIVVDSSQNVLSYTAVSDIQTVEDVSVVRPVTKKTAARKPKSIAKVPTAIKKSKVSKKVKASTATGATKKVKASSVDAAAKERLPKTGNAIWLKALGRKKLTQNQLTDGTLSLLKLGEEARAAIRNRAGAWLNTAVKKNQVTAGTNRAGLKVYEAVQA